MTRATLRKTATRGNGRLIQEIRKCLAEIVAKFLSLDEQAHEPRQLVPADQACASFEEKIQRERYSQRCGALARFGKGRVSNSNGYGLADRDRDEGPPSHDQRSRSQLYTGNRGRPFPKRLAGGGAARQPEQSRRRIRGTPPFLRRKLGKMSEPVIRTIGKHQRRHCFFIATSLPLGGGNGNDVGSGG
jgi:hypothetical protein